MPARVNSRFGWGLGLGIALIALGVVGSLAGQMMYRGRWCDCHQCWPDPVLFPTTAQFPPSGGRSALRGADVNAFLRLSMLAGDAVLVTLFAGFAGVRMIGWLRRVHDQIPPPPRACPLCSYPMENPEQRVCPECGAHVAGGSEAIALRQRLRAGGVSIGSPGGDSAPNLDAAAARVRCAVCRLEYEVAFPPSGTDVPPPHAAGEAPEDEPSSPRCPRCPRCHSAATVPVGDPFSGA